MRVSPVEAVLLAAVADTQWTPARPLLGFSTHATRDLGGGYTAQISGNDRAWWWDAWHHGAQIGPRNRTVDNPQAGMRAAIRRIAEHRAIEADVTAGGTTQ